MDACRLAVAPPAAAFAAARAQFEAVVTHLSSAEALGMTHSHLERTLEVEGRELLRRLFQGHLDLRGPGETAAPVTGADGVRRTHCRPQARGLLTVFGPVTVRRLGYGRRRTTSLHPLDAALNLPPDLYSFGVRRRAAEAAATGSFAATVERLARATGAAVGKRQVEQLVVRAAADFEAFYARRQAPPAPPASGSLLVLSVDGKGVVMRAVDLRDATREAAARRTHKLATRLTRGEKRTAKRMATVAAVYTIAPFVRAPEDIVADLAAGRDSTGPRPRPERKRVWASLAHPAREVIDQAFREAHARDPDRRKTWVALVDGDRAQLRLLRALARRHGAALTIVLDIIHVIEHLWQAVGAFHQEGSPEAEAWVTARLLRILQGRASHVAAGMRRSATRRRLPARQPVDACAGYLLGHAPFLRYHAYLAAGLPIATGVIEGACRHLIKDRMDLTGARWRLSGAEAVLCLRALQASGDADAYWPYHEAQELERNHVAHYADRAVPPPTPPPAAATGRGALRLVR